MRPDAAPAAALLVLLLGAGLLAAPAQTWLMLGGDLTEYLAFETLRGQVPYLLSKLCALYAVELVWLQAMLGLLRHRIAGTCRIDAVRWKRMHALLGTAALLTVFAHVTLYVAAASMRNRAAALDLLLPWGHGVYRTWVACGAASLWLLVVAAAAQAVRSARRLGARSRLRLHRLALAAVALVAVHSLAIGSETRSAAMAWMYGLMGVALCAAAADRMLAQRRPPLPRS